EKFKYYSCHYTWYNRFGEKGFTAPANVHPNNIRKDHDGRVNFTQRFPHQAKEITEHREEYDILSKAFHPFFEYLRPQLRHLLPEEYAELDVYIEVLPLSASCPSAPFGGFVVNVNSCTWGHRDGDCLLCLVVP
ncbi:hypothetical protein B0H10DRAFT_1638466, partial [Mycena sp. CBHHK59/15]